MQVNHKRSDEGCSSSVRYCTVLSEKAKLNLSDSVREGMHEGCSSSVRYCTVLSEKAKPNLSDSVTLTELYLRKAQPNLTGYRWLIYT